MNRNIYNFSNSWGSYQELSINDTGYWKNVLEGKPPHLHPYLWYRFDGTGNTDTCYAGVVTQRDSHFNDSRSAWESGVIVCSPGNVRVPCKAMPELVTGVRNRLDQKVRNREIDLGVALGEYRETASFVSSAMVKTARSYQRLRRGDVSGALQVLTGKKNRNWRDIPGAAANTWLAYTYGLSPLLRDVHDAVSLYERRYQRYPEVSVVRSSQRATIAGTATYNFRTEDFPGVFRVIRQSSGCTADLRVSGCVSFRVTNPVLRKLDECGVINPLSVAWELVPFSFVVDWFIPVGRFIQSVVPPQGVDFVSGWLVESARGSALCEAFIDPGDGRDPWQTSATSIEVFKRRTVLGSFPRYHVQVPDLSLSKGQITSGISLLTQQLLGGRRY